MLVAPLFTVHLYYRPLTLTPSAAVSKQLGVLRRARLVRSRRHGRERDYSLDAAQLEPYAAWLQRFVPVWEDSLRTLKRRAGGS